ncbi:hypothetical protein UO65_1494 [Actinokineospora spheciospongiae]|uniref:Uncharacterized protein n=1 Tax=Actinokineospora spheciospongiae TaxID=909613 RepID=W7IQV6_9PSEU|nr:hypothetical protein UO65_1494 [Actinokineospora spheciospongiae]
MQRQGAVQVERGGRHGNLTGPGFPGPGGPGNPWDRVTWSPRGPAPLDGPAERGRVDRRRGGQPDGARLANLDLLHRRLQTWERNRPGGQGAPSGQW